jgi:hypothetical protein
MHHRSGIAKLEEAPDYATCDWRLVPKKIVKQR